MKCKNCKWFSLGRCHRHPPIDGRFSSVVEDDWCGDFEASVTQHREARIQPKVGEVFTIDDDPTPYICILGNIFCDGCCFNNHDHCSRMICAKLAREDLQGVQYRRLS